MVDHLTRVTVDARTPRALELALALSNLGFAVRDEGPRIVADSTAVEARALKEALRARGFEDRAYQVYVEFVRRWGIL